MSVSIEFGFGAGAADKRIIRRNATVVAEPQHLSDVGAQVLRENSRAVVIGGDKPVAIANRQVHHAVRPERRSSSEGAARLPGIRHENVVDSREPAILEASA